MIVMLRQLYIIFFLRIFTCFSIENQPKLTLNEFFNTTTYPLLSFSPTGEHLLIQTRRPSWNTSSYENTLWLYDIQNQTKRIVTTNLQPSIKPQWSPSGKFIAFIPKKDDKHPLEQSIYVYSLLTNTLLSIPIGREIPLALTWSHNDSSIYLASVNVGSIDNDSEWHDVIQYRQNAGRPNATIFRIGLNFNNYSLLSQRNIIRNLSFLINQLLYAPLEQKLLFTSASKLIENLNDFELYSIDLRNTTCAITKLTHNEAYELNLQLSVDGRHVLFQMVRLSSNKGKFNDTQVRLYSLNLRSRQITRLGKHFHGSISGFTPKCHSGVYILGHLGTEVHVYRQKSVIDEEENLISYDGWNGTYESMVVSCTNHQSIAFVHSSYAKPMEVYLIKNINQLKSAKAITNENQLFLRRNLPQVKVYSWKNKDDHRTIEGLLHYPPGRFQSKNLPLLVLIHGGPYYASINKFDLNWYQWGTLAASEGWLVLEPNYRGSTGYGDQFLNEIRYKPLSRPGKDILFGIDQLIKDGIVDPSKLAVGGYSYGGLLTNWLITETRRFNAALSGAGAVDLTATWGIMDLPVLICYLFGGYPWEVAHTYQNESPIYRLNRIRTPTHISTGENDIRVPTSQSYMLERGLHYLGVPVKLIIFPKEGHTLNMNPWHGKIKIREELRWLRKYGNQSLNNTDRLCNHSQIIKLTYTLQLYIFLLSIIIINRPI